MWAEVQTDGAEAKWLSWLRSCFLGILLKCDENAIIEKPRMPKLTDQIVATVELEFIRLAMKVMPEFVKSRRPEVSELKPSDWKEVRGWTGQSKESSKRFAVETDGAGIESGPLIKVSGDGTQYSLSYSFQYSLLEMIVRAEEGKEQRSDMFSSKKRRGVIVSKLYDDPVFGRSLKQSLSHACGT